MLSIDAANHLNITGNQVVVNQGVVSPLLLSAQGDINVSNAAKIKNFNSGGDIYLYAQNINVGENTQIANVGLVNLNAAAAIDIKKSARVKAVNDLNIIAKQGLSVADANLVAEKGNMNLQSNSNITLQGTTLDLTKDLNINGTGNVNLSSLNFTLLNGSSTLQNINAYSGLNLVWDQTAKALPQISGNVTLEAANLIDLKGSNLSGKGDLKLQGKALNVGADLTAGKSLNLTATQSDLILNKNLNAQGNIDIASLDGKLNATGLNATSSQGKLSIFGAKDTVLTNAGTIKTTLKGNQGVNVGTIGTGNLTLQNTVLESENGAIVVTSEGQNTLTDSTITAKGNIELFAKNNLTLDGVKASSQQHTALNSKKNIYINSQAGTGDTVNFSSTKTTELNSTGTLSLISDKNQNLQNTKLTGGAILLEAGGTLNTPKAIEFNATSSDLLKNDSKLSSLNGDLSIQTKESLTIDPTIHILKAVGDIELVSKQGTLTLAGYGGQAGNGSEKVVNLTTTDGGISLEGASVEVQGAQLNAQKDIKIVSTQGNVKIDGVRNTIIGSIPTALINNLNTEKAQSQQKINELNTDQNYVEKKKVIFDQIEREKKIANSAGPNLPACGPCKAAIGNIARLHNQYKELAREEVKLLENIINIDKEIIYYNQIFNGYEHAQTNLISNTGNISIASKKGTSISGANVSAKTGQVNIEAQGVLGQLYTSTATKGVNGQPTQIGASIIIDGHTDFYDRGNENDANYSMRTFISPTIINGDKGVTIRATGNTNQDNVVLQATGITAANGDVRIEANKKILFDAAIEQSYDRSTTTEKKRSWGGVKKKYITTVAESNHADAASVDISGKNIFIESKEKNTANNIDIYSGKLTANGGQVSILSGGNINLYTVQESSSSNVDITKKSSFAGIKYNKSNTTSTRSQISELPGVLKADYIGIKADNDVRLVGTEFEYLQGAKIEAGRELSLLTASTTVTETLKKDKNSVVWQSMQDKGSVTETAQLPRFNGPTLPEFKAGGGLSVQIPISEKDVNKKELSVAVLELANRPGNEYLKELVKRDDIDWQKVILTQKDWDYKSQGLTGAGAAILVIIVTVVTMGAGAAGAGAALFGTTGATTTAMANAFVTSLASQASVSLINNGGDLGKTLKDLGSKDSVRNLAASVVTAGLLSQVSTALNLKPDSSLLSDRLINNFTTSVGSTLVQTAIKGGDLEDNLKVALLAGLAGAVQGELASQIGTHLDKVDPNVFEYAIHKIAHAAVGCAVAAATKSSCEAGAIGAGVGEIVASLMPDPANGIEYNEDEKIKIRNTGKIVAGVVSAYAGYDVNTAANSADIAIQNNYLTHYTKAKFVSELTACKVKLSDCEAVIQKYQSTSKINDLELTNICNNPARRSDCNLMLQAALDYAGDDFNKIYGINSSAMKNLQLDQARSRELVLKNIFKDNNSWFGMINDIDLRADFFSAMYAKTGAEWFKVANQTSRAAFTGLGAEGNFSSLTFGIGNLISTSDAYAWRDEAGAALMKGGFKNFKELYEGKVNDINAWNIKQLREEQLLLQSIHEKYFANYQWKPMVWIPEVTMQVNLLDYNSRIQYGCKKMGYTVSQGCTP